jgi:IMP dehydrogenase
MKIEKCYDFDDVLIKPLPSEISSRDNVDISVKLSRDVTLSFPLIASPMVGVVNASFAHELSELGGLAILHRFYSSEEELFSDIKKYITPRDIYGLSIRIDNDNIESYLAFEPSIILVDTANGYIEKLLRYCEKVKSTIIKERSSALLMAGNVVTQQGCLDLYNAGCDLIRVGIGGGSLCSTRNVTGVSVPNISAIVGCCTNDYTYKIVIDGGIKGSGDFVKAIVAGADLGMAGMLYAQCFESPAKGTIFGMASRTNMKNTHTEIKSVEGFDIEIKKKYSLEQFVREFGYGIKSAGTYLNAKNLQEIYVNGEFVEVSDHAIKKGI